MGKPVFLDPIDYISGKIARKYRTIYCHRKQSDRRYTTVRSKRTSDPSQDELAARERFASVSRAVAARKKSLATLATDQAAFLAQKEQPNGKKTFTSYLWSLELASYDQAHS